MKTLVLYLIPFAFLTFSTSPKAQQWKISDNYEIQFSGSGADGTFRGLAGTIHFDPENLAESQFDVTVDVNTISTGNKTKDKHAKDDSWFDAEVFPQMRFVSSQVTRTANGYQATGNLEVHGIKKELVLPFTFTPGGNGGVFEGTFTVNRKDFDITGPLFGFMVGDKFEVNAKVPVTRM